MDVRQPGFTPAIIGGIKVDGTTFHHGGTPIPSTFLDRRLRHDRILLQRRSRTPILPSRSRRATKFSLALLTMANYTNLRDWGLRP